MSRSLPAGPMLVGICLLAQAASAFAQSGDCLSCGPAPSASCTPEKMTCPPYFWHYFEGAPKIKFKRGCPRPICDPCHLPHYGYFAPCWAPNPFQQDWSHCPYPVASAMLPPPATPPYAPRVPASPDRRGTTPTTPGTEGPRTPMTPARPMIPELPSPKPFESDKEKGKEVGLLSGPQYTTQPVQFIAAVTTTPAPQYLPQPVQYAPVMTTTTVPVLVPVGPRTAVRFIQAK